MADATASKDIRALEDSYRIVGELRSANGNVRRYVGTRKSDGAQVMISVVDMPEGAENNELSHFAADEKLLGGLRHPSVLSVLDGRWIGNSFALITERPSGTTLLDELDRGAEFRNPRIAMVLQDVWSGLEAARDQGVVHRWVSLDSVYFDEASKRPVVALLPTPIPITGVPGAAADARTVGSLAWAMMTSKPFDPKSNAKLGELAPNLASRVVETVERLVRLRDTEASPDVATALGVIAAGDVLKQGEIEIQAMKEEYHELHRQELEKCETHRMETEQYAAEQAALITDERALLERLAAEQSASLAAERQEFEKLMTAREERIIGLRLDLEREAARAARAIDVKSAAALLDEEEKPARASRSLAPTITAAVVLGLITLAAYAREQMPRAPSSSRVPVGSSAVVPTAPSVDTTRLKPGGFLSQSAGGNVSGSRPSGPPIATPKDSARAAVPDSAAADSAARAAARAQAQQAPKESTPAKPRPHPTDRATDVNGSIPAPPIDTLAPRPNVDTSRPDTTSRMDTSFTRGSPGTVPPRDPATRDSAPRRESVTNPVPLPGDPSVKVETTYVRGSVQSLQRDTTTRRPP
jgi:hypothetical protein